MQICTVRANERMLFNNNQRRPKMENVFEINIPNIKRSNILADYLTGWKIRTIRETCYNALLVLSRSK